MLKAKRLTKKCILGGEAKLREGNSEILWAVGIIPSDIPVSRKGVYLFYNPPNNFSRRMHVDRSYIFCGFFRVSLCGIVNQPLNFSYHWLLPKEFFCPWPTKFSENACSFLSLYSVEIKSDEGYEFRRRISSNFFSRDQFYPLRARRNYSVGYNYQ